MRTLAVAAAVGCAVLSGLACGGGAFSAGAGADGGVDATADAGSDVAAADGAVADVVEEPPASCTGDFACVPVVPAGWRGPLEVYTGSGTVPPCSTGFDLVQDANDTLTATHAACGCACGSPAMQCTTPTLSVYSSVGCGAAPCDTVQLTAAACTTIDTTGKCGATVGGPLFSAPQSTVADAGCPPQPTVSTSPVSWGTNARACSSSLNAAVDCAAGTTCASKPAAPFGTALCIGLAGDNACPSAYAGKHVYFGGVADTRGCTSCSCAPSGFTCAARLDAYQTKDQSCAGLPDTFFAPLTCDPVPQPADLKLSVTPTLGSCTPSQSTPSGAALPIEPFTVCCQQ